MRILFLDDAQIRHDMFARAHGGDEVVHVFTGPEATRALDEQGPFDLVHLDHDLTHELVLERSGGLHEEPEECDPPLGNPPLVGTGMDVVRHIVEMPPELHPSRVVVHTHNPIGADMVRLLELAGVPSSWRKL
jgi:CheY-like chemotaxis protein